MGEASRESQALHSQMMLLLMTDGVHHKDKLSVSSVRSFLAEVLPNTAEKGEAVAVGTPTGAGPGALAPLFETDCTREESETGSRATLEAPGRDTVSLGG